MKTLRSRVVRLAHDNPELRAPLLPLLRREAARWGSKSLVKTDAGWVIEINQGSQVEALPIATAVVAMGGKPPRGNDSLDVFFLRDTEDQGKRLVEDYGTYFLTATAAIRQAKRWTYGELREVGTRNVPLSGIVVDNRVKNTLAFRPKAGVYTSIGIDTTRRPIPVK